jgi:hypothetical protein
MSAKAEGGWPRTPHPEISRTDPPETLGHAVGFADSEALIGAGAAPIDWSEVP